MPGVPLLTLNNGVRIPQLGFGTYKIGPADTVDATLVLIPASVNGAMFAFARDRDSDGPKSR